MIDIKNISAGYGTKTILKDITAGAQGGEFIALLGPNGSGKSTLLKTLCGLIKPSAGSLSLAGLPAHDMPPKQRAKTAAYLAQGREATRGLEVSDILDIGRAPYRGALGKISALGRAAIQDAAKRAQITELIGRQFDTLSGGEKARVLFARALAVQAPILLADEPIAALDPYYQITMMESLAQEARSGRLVIAALHDLFLARQYASRIWVMKEGRLYVDDMPSAALSAKTLADVFGVAPPKDGLQSLKLSVQT